MSLSVSSFDYVAFLEGLSNEKALQWAQDLFSLATGVEDMPTDPREIRIVERAIFTMAWYLQTDHENREEYMSEFSGERIGQYNYTKMYKSVKDGEDTKVPAFDFAVAYFNDKGVEELPMTVSEHIFTQPFTKSQDW